MSEHRVAFDLDDDHYEMEWRYTVGHPGGLWEPPSDDEVEVLSIVRNGRFKMEGLVKLLNEDDIDRQHPFHKLIERMMEVHWARQADAEYAEYKEIEDIFDEEAKDQQEQAGQ